MPVEPGELIGRTFKIIFLANNALLGPIKPTPKTAIAGIDIELTSSSEDGFVGTAITKIPFKVTLGGVEKTIPVGSPCKFTVLGKDVDDTIPDDALLLSMFEHKVFPNPVQGGRRKTRKQKHRKGKSKRRATHRR